VSVKNRIHNQMDKYDLKPEFTDIFENRTMNGFETYNR